MALLTYKISVVSLRKEKNNPENVERVAEKLYQPHLLTFYLLRYSAADFQLVSLEGDSSWEEVWNIKNKS